MRESTLLRPRSIGTHTMTVKTVKRLLRRPLTVRDILRWADAYRESTGKWPTKASGLVVGARFETWARIDNALRLGLRNLPVCGSLARLLETERGARNLATRPPLTCEQILAWADAHRERTGAWPTAKSGTVLDAPGEQWTSINVALRAGARKLPGGSSLAQLLAEHRGVRNRKALPPLLVTDILAWAQAHRERTGRWPSSGSGPIVEAPGETWMAVEMALSHGQRHLPGGSSLRRLLAVRFAVRHPRTQPDFSLPQILAWADAHCARHGQWPGPNSGAIPEASGETWCAVNHALLRGTRGLPGGLSLAERLVAERGARNASHLPKLSRKRILAWADAFHRRTGKWPTNRADAIPEAPDETWSAVDAALRDGGRGLRGGSSLARLLSWHRGKRNHRDLPPVSRRKILDWADEHHARTGRWPNVNSGEVVAAPGEKWALLDQALRQGQRRLPGGSSLLRLLAKKRGVRNPLQLPSLTEARILEWARQHAERTGRLPKYNDGPIREAVGETWSGVDGALRYGRRDLPGGSSLAKLLKANDR